MSEIDYISNTILYTDRLCLRPLRDEDAPQIFALRSDATVNQYLDRTPCKTLEDAKVFISGIIERTKDSSLYYWAVCMQDECIGAVCLFDFSEEEQSIEIGFELLPKVDACFGKTIAGRLIKNADDLAMLLLEDAHVALVSGDAFGAPDCIRISYSLSEDKIREAIRRIARTLDKV